MSFSVVIPFFNEEYNAEILLEEIDLNLKEIYKNYEIILINDASTDNTYDVLKNIHKKNNKVKIINNIRNLGQSYSLLKGIKESKYDTIMTIDGDGQNNPIDMPILLSQYFENPKVDLVSGIRIKRKDNFIKKISSKIANKVRKFILNDDCDDTGCSLKVFNKKIFLKFTSFKGLHRFLPALFKGYKCKVLFIPVDHRERKYGKSNYGIIKRLIFGCIDIIRVLFILKKMRND